MKQLPMGDAEYRSLARIAQQLEFFAPLKGAELEAILSRIQMYGFGSGETIFQKGAMPDALYIIHEGEITIRLSRWFALRWKMARLGPGNLFGERALLQNKPHSATAVAKTDSKLFALLRTDFDALLRQNPTFSAGIRWVADRRQFESNH